MKKIKSILAALTIALFTLNSCDSDIEKFTPDKEQGKVDPVPEPEPEPEPLQDWQEEVVNATVQELAQRRMPTVTVTTVGGQDVTSKETYIQGTILFEDKDGRYTSIASNGGKMQIRGRGNTSWGQPKKPYRIKLDEKARVFGMPVEKDWCLIAAYSDKTLMRNPLGMYISRLVGLRWSPRMRYCNLYFNGSYQGVYLVVEHKEVGKAKVNIKPVGSSVVSGDDLSGDYYLEIESVLSDQKYIKTQCMCVQFKDPDKPNDAQYDYIKNYLSDIENALNSSSRGDATKGYPAYLEIDSFVNNFILQELAKNIDGNMRKSTFMVKPRGGKMQLYHVWDFDLAYGNCDYLTDSGYGTTNGPEGWYVRDFGDNGYHKTWYYNLFKDPAFVARLKARWIELYPALRDDVPQFIEDTYTLIEKDAENNFKKWNILNQYDWPNMFYRGTYRQHVDFMKDYYLRRLAWMDSEIRKM